MSAGRKGNKEIALYVDLELKKPAKFSWDHLTFRIFISEDGGNIYEVTLPSLEGRDAYYFMSYANAEEFFMKSLVLLDTDNYKLRSVSAYTNQIQYESKERSYPIHATVIRDLLERSGEVCKKLFDPHVRVVDWGLK